MENKYDQLTKEEAQKNMFDNLDDRLSDLQLEINRIIETSKNWNGYDFSSAMVEIIKSMI